jgi:hypothetical protein
MWWTVHLMSHIGVHPVLNVHFLVRDIQITVHQTVISKPVMLRLTYNRKCGSSFLEKSGYTISALKTANAYLLQ